MGRAAYFPAPYPGELIFSVLCRLQLHTGGVSAGAVIRNVLERRGGSRHSAIPYELVALERASAGAIRATEQELRERSMLSPFIALMPPSRRLALLEACRAGSAPARTRALAGLNRYRAPAQMLKSCSACTAEQLASHESPHWVAALQRPGVWICRVHHRVLDYIQTTGRNPGWHLPTEGGGAVPNVAVDTLHRYLSIQTCIEWLSRQDHVDTGVLQVLVRTRLRQAGMCRSEVKLLAAEIEHLSMMSNREVAQLSAPDIIEVNSAPWLKAALYEGRQYNPMVWALAITWSGPRTPQNLDVEYREAAERKPQRGLFDPYSRSVRRIYAPGVLYQAMQAASTRAQMIKMTGMSLAEIESWMRKDPALHEHWKQSLRRRRLESAVAALKQFFKDWPDALRVDALRECRPEYRWMELNEPRLLNRLLPPPTNHLPDQLPLPW